MEESIGSSSAPFTADNASVELFGAPRNGAFRGNYMGFSLFATGNAPSNAGNWSGAMTPIGAQARVTLTSSERPLMEVVNCARRGGRGGERMV